jgi:hypothetical protein
VYVNTEYSSWIYYADFVYICDAIL